MPIELLHDLSELSDESLFKVYLAIAEADHRWRVRSMYGDQLPPCGHSELRPLRRERFLQRMTASRAIPGGEQMLRQRLARQASAYQVDLDAVLDQGQQAVEYRAA